MGGMGTGRGRIGGKERRELARLYTVLEEEGNICERYKYRTASPPLISSPQEVENEPSMPP